MCCVHRVSSHGQVAFETCKQTDIQTDTVIAILRTHAMDQVITGRIRQALELKSMVYGSYKRCAYSI